MRLLTVDIETFPHEVYAWGLHDQNIAINQIKKAGVIASIAAKFHGERKVHFASVHHDGEKGMLRKAHELLSEADAVIGWNSTPFDVKWIKGQLLKHRFQPLKPFKQIDLLRTARAEFRLPSYKLDYVAQFLGIGCKVQTGGFDLWKDCMAGDEKAWRKMRRYNIGDTVLTEKVYDVLRPYVKNHPNIGVFEGRPCCPKCGGEKIQSRGEYVTREKSYPQFQCRTQGCFAWLYLVGGKLQEGMQRLRSAA
jgi:DNA polymerase elongation subunit (family B)